MKIKGVIFDFDGLILDTETPELKSWETIYLKYGIAFPINIYKNNIGSKFDDVSSIEYLANKLQSVKISKFKIQQEFGELKNSLINKEPLLPGVLNYLKDAKSFGLRIGLASSSNSAWIHYHLNRLDLKKYFDSILTKDDVKKVKPFPDLFLLSLLRLGITKNEAIVFEDSFNGVSAAKTAQVFTIAIPNPVTKSFNFKNADIVFDSLTEISLSELIKMIEGKNKKIYHRE